MHLVRKAPRSGSTVFSGYTFTAVSKSPSGRISETSYGILHDGYEYTLTFLVPPKHKDEYVFQFDDIARTFEIADS